MIHCDNQGDLWVVTIDRPEKAGALTRDMLQDLAEIAEAARPCKALILTGKGRVFSAGADLKEAHAGLCKSRRQNGPWKRPDNLVIAE